MDFTGDGRALHLDAGLQVLRQLVQPLLRFTQLTIGMQARAAGFAGLDRLHQGGYQTRQIVLQQVVAGAVAHGLDGGVLADLARHQDEGNVGASGHQQVQRHQTGKAGKVVVGHDHIPGLVERAQKVGLGVHPARDDRHVATLQMRQRELVVNLGILQMQQSQWLIGGSAGHGTSMPWGQGFRTDPGLPL